jgi:hypothetical protein
VTCGVLSHKLNTFKDDKFCYGIPASGEDAKTHNTRIPKTSSRKS